MNRVDSVDLVWEVKGPLDVSDQGSFLEKKIPDVQSRFWKLAFIDETTYWKASSPALDVEMNGLTIGHPWRLAKVSRRVCAKETGLWNYTTEFARE